MKHLLLTTIAAVLVVGCGESQPPEPPDISIHDAAKGGNIEAVKQHLAAGTDLEAKDVGDGTPLHNAAWGRHTEIVELLIAKGADVNAKSEIGTTPLHFAASGGHMEIAKLLIAAGADVNAKRGMIGGTPLHEAAHKGHKEVTALLIAKGADVNAKGGDGTPLDRAIKQQFGATLARLAVRAENLTAVGYSEQKYKETADLLRKHGAKTGKALGYR